MNIYKDSETFRNSCIRHVCVQILLYGGRWGWTEESHILRKEAALWTVGAAADASVCMYFFKAAGEQAATAGWELSFSIWLLQKLRPWPYVNHAINLTLVWSELKMTVSHTSVHQSGFRKTFFFFLKMLPGNVQSTLIKSHPQSREEEQIFDVLNSFLLSSMQTSGDLEQN